MGPVKRVIGIALVVAACADGAPAWDGIVERSGDGFALRLPDGTAHALSGSPAAFADLIGACVWVTETAAHGVASYGVIRGT